MNKKIYILGGILGGIIILGGLWFAFMKWGGDLKLPGISSDNVVLKKITPAPIDTDGDRLSDDLEKQYKTDKTKPDTDGDGLSDFDEVIIYETNPLVVDTDGDGFTDAQEIKAGFDPVSKDTEPLP